MANQASPINSSPPAQSLAQQQQAFANAFSTPNQPKTPVYTTTYNPGIAGQPYMGQNSQYANNQANFLAGTGISGQQVTGTTVATNPPMQKPINQVPTQQQGTSTPQPIQQPQQQIQQQQTQQSQLNPSLNQQIAPQAFLQQPGMSIPGANMLPQQQQQAGQITQQSQIQSTELQPVQYNSIPGGIPQQTTQQISSTGQNVPGQPVNLPNLQAQFTSPEEPDQNPVSQLQAYNTQTGQIETVSPDDPRFESGTLVQNASSYQTGTSSPSQNIQNVLNSGQNQSFSNLYQNALNNPGMSGADLLQQSLQMQLGAIDDPNVNTYLNNMATRTQQSYAIGMGMVSASQDELSKAISGTLTSPETYIGQQAKVLGDQKDLNLQSIQAQQDWQKAQSSSQIDQLQTNRADLEGFLKAQLAMQDGTDTGASTAALSVMSQSLHSADMNLTLANAGNNYAQAQLSIQGSNIMKDYADQMSGLGAEIMQQRAQTTQQYYDGLNQIDQNALANEQEKRQATAQAIGSYSTQMTDLWNQTQNRGLQYAQLNFQKTNSLVQNQLQASGVYGYAMTQDANGNFTPVTDSNGQPVMTMAARQNQFTNSISSAQLGLQTWQANSSQIQAIASDAIQTGNFAAAGQAISNLTGTPIPQGLSGQDFTNYVNGHISGSSQSLQQITDGKVNQIPQGIQQIFGVGSNGGQCGVYAGSISTAPNVGNTWDQKIATVRANGNIQSDPQPGYKMVIPLGGANTDGNDPGHVETVVSYDKNTGNMMLAQSNMDLKGTVSMDIRNIHDVQQQFGNNWGFVPGQLKSNIQSQLNNYVSQNGSQVQTQPYGQVDYAALGNAISSQASGFASIAQGIANYTLDPSTTLSGMPTGQKANILSQVSQINPNYNQNNYTNNGTFLSNWQSTATGTTGFKNQSINNALNALSATYNAVKTLKPGDFQPANQLSQLIGKTLGQSSVSNVYSESAPVVGELAKAFTGGTPDSEAMATYSALFDPNQSQSQFMTNIQNLAESLGGQLNTNVEEYKSTMQVYPQNTLTGDAMSSMKNMGLDPTKYDPSLQQNIPKTGSSNSTAQTTFNLSSQVQTNNSGYTFGSAGTSINSSFFPSFSQ